MHRGLVLAFALIVAGALVVALPDDDSRLFSISRDHGPSRVDAVGVAVVLAGWSAFVYELWRRRTRVLARLGFAGVAILSVVLVAGVALVAWAVLGDRGAWWICGVVLASAPQLVAAAAAYGRSAR